MRYHSLSISNIDKRKKGGRSSLTTKEECSETKEKKLESPRDLATVVRRLEGDICKVFYKRTVMTHFSAER